MIGVCKLTNASEHGLRCNGIRLDDPIAVALREVPGLLQLTCTGSIDSEVALWSSSVTASASKSV